MTGDGSNSDHGIDDDRSREDDTRRETDRKRSGESVVDTGRDRLVGYLVTFVRELDQRGVEVPRDASIEAARALAVVGLDDRERVRLALRSALITREEDLDVFDAHFPEFWRQLREKPDPLEGVLPEMGRRSPVPPSSPGGDTETESTETDMGEDASMDAFEEDTDESRRNRLDESVAPGRTGSDSESETDEDGPTAAVYSPTGRPERVGIPPRSGVESALESAVDRLRSALARRPGRRWSREGEEDLDVRRVLRESVTAGGTVLSVPTRGRSDQSVSAVILVDVSRSVLDTIDRDFLIRFCRLAHAEFRSVRIFFFDTDVREVTDHFDAPTTAAAAAALERAETEWGGGTRIGHALDVLRREHPDAFDRETVTMIVSDGLEVGELDVLEDGMAWLARHSSALLWLNPLAAAPAYEPTCRGMASALPYCDGLFAFAEHRDVEELADQLERRGLGGSVGYEFDRRRSERV